LYAAPARSRTETIDNDFERGGVTTEGEFECLFPHRLDFALKQRFDERCLSGSHSLLAACWITGLAWQEGHSTPDCNPLFLAIPELGDGRKNCGIVHGGQDFY